MRSLNRTLQRLSKLCLIEDQRHHVSSFPFPDLFYQPCLLTVAEVMSNPQFELLRLFHRHHPNPLPAIHIPNQTNDTNQDLNGSSNAAVTNGETGED